MRPDVIENVIKFVNQRIKKGEAINLWHYLMGATSQIDNCESLEDQAQVSADIAIACVGILYEMGNDVAKIHHILKAFEKPKIPRDMTVYDIGRGLKWADTLCPININLAVSWKLAILRARR